MLIEEQMHGKLVDGLKAPHYLDFSSIEHQELLVVQFVIQLKHSNMLKLPTSVQWFVYNGSIVLPQKHVFSLLLNRD